MDIPARRTTAPRTAEVIATDERWSAHNYHPLPVVVAEAKGTWVTDVDGRRFIDMLAGYSALNFGHCNERLLEVARKQLERVTLTSRAFYNDQLGEFSRSLAELCGMEAVLPMNTGAEAVETAVKLARRWSYDVKGVPTDKAKIIVCDGNFHGRTTTIVSFSTDPSSRSGFGPFTPGFEVVPYGDIDALRNAIDENTAGFLFEPIQGEAGVVLPPKGYLGAAHALCKENNVLFMADEIQAGLGRTGSTFACDLDDLRPDVFILGKALGGGIVPLSAVVSDWEIMGVIGWGEHGSTFGGNPLACAVGAEVVKMMNEGNMQRRANEMGAKLINGLRKADFGGVKEVRGVGLWVGLELQPGFRSGREVSEALMAQGLLCKDTHETTIRFSPPLVITESEVDWSLERVAEVLG